MDQIGEKGPNAGRIAVPALTNAGPLAVGFSVQALPMQFLALVRKLPQRLMDALVHLVPEFVGRGVFVLVE